MKNVLFIKTELIKYKSDYEGFFVLDDDNKLYIGTSSGWKELTNEDVDLSSYMKIVDADKKYIPKSSGTGSGASLSISTTGAFNNFGNNGQAFNAVRDLTGITPIKYNTATGSSFPLNAASFGVKDNGTTAFSHKKYTTFNKDTGAYTGARNTAVLVFSGNSGLLYAKNTGSAADVTDDMYKYVGVIDSPDEKQRCYSAKQVDGITDALANRITDLEGQNEYLMNVIGVLINKLGITDDELADALGDTTAQQSLTNIEDDVNTNIKNNTEDYSNRSTEPSYDNNIV